MPKVSDAHREQRRRQILEAAQRCFVRNGVGRTQMVDVIAESGLSTGAVYSYFPSKESLMRETAAEVLASRERGDAERLMADGRTVETPRALVRRILDEVRADPSSRMLVQLWGEAVHDEVLRETVGAVSSGMRRRFEAGLERWADAHRGVQGTGSSGSRPDPTPPEWSVSMSHVLIGAVPGLLVQREFDPDFDEAAYVAAVVSLLPEG